MAENPQRPPRPSTARPAPPAGTQPTAEMERALALRDVMDHAVKVQREVTQPIPGPASTTRTVVVGLLCVSLLGVSVYSFVARPEIIWGPGVVERPPARQEADMRFAMFLMAQRVESYRDAQGVYPPSLADVSDAAADVRYAVLADSVFELRATAGGRELVYRSDAPADAFLGNSPRVIQGLAETPR